MGVKYNKKFIQIYAPVADWNWLEFTNNADGIPVRSITCTGGEGVASKYFLFDKEGSQQIVIFPDRLIQPGDSETIYYYGAYIKLCFLKEWSIINPKSRIIISLR